MKKNTLSLVVAGKESGLEINADKTKYMFMSQNQHAGQNHNIKTNYRTLTNQSSIREEIKSRVT
jgi:hypothetical protein